MFLNKKHSFMKRNAKAGFTLIEMLIVVAVIAILIVISIPAFTGMLERSREAADLASVRSAYGELMSAVALDDRQAKFGPDGERIYKEGSNSYSVSIRLRQKQSGWQMGEENVSIAGISKKTSSRTQLWVGAPGKTCIIKYSPNEIDGKDCLTVNWTGFMADATTHWNRVDDTGNKLEYNGGHFSPNCISSSVSQMFTVPVSEGNTIWGLTAQGLKVDENSALDKNFTYSFGFFTIDPSSKDGSTYQFYQDSGEVNFSYYTDPKAEYTASDMSWGIAQPSNGSENVDMVIQLFKFTGSGDQKTYYQMTDAETTELLSYLTLREMDKNNTANREYHSLVDYVK